MNTSKEILKQFGLSKTEPRLQILELMLDRACAISESEINNLLGNACDRTTVYRTLKSFEKKDLVYKISADDGQVRFLLNLPPAAKPATGPVHNHLHFHCIKCDKLVCIENAAIPAVQLPVGFTALRKNFVIDGICQSCGLKPID